MSEERANTALITVDSEETVDQVYDRIATLESDVKYQLPILRRLASECRHVTEMGTREALSTIALMAGHPETVVTWDIEPQWIQRALLLNCLKKGYAPQGRWDTVLEARVGNSLKISSIEPTDMLWIDTLHNFEQLRSELKRHGNQARKYLAFHDTAPETFGYKDETGSGPGLRAAIRWFQEQNLPRWQLALDDKTGSGIIVLARHNVPFPPFFGAEFLAEPRDVVA